MAISLKRLQRLTELGIEGLNWYDQAYDEIDLVCSCQRWDQVRFAQVLALCSPRVTVTRCVRNALMYCEHRELFDNTLSNVKRSLTHYERTGELRGQKVYAFSTALLGCESAIVLDTWIAKAMRIPQQSFQTQEGRLASEQAIRTIAKRIEECPRDTQAALWCGTLIDRGLQPRPLPVLREHLNFILHSRQFPKGGKIRDMTI